MTNAVELATAYVSLVADTARMAPAVRRALGDVEDEAERSGRRAGERLSRGMGGALGGLKKAFGAAAAVGVGVGIADTFKDAIQGASDLSESTNKVAQIFGSAQTDVMTFASKGAKALGMTNLQARNAAATFGVFGKSAQLSGSKLSGFSTGMATLATDLASFHNTSPEEAIEALSAALRGESEPIRKYGVLLDDASMRQQAMAMGLVKTTKTALTPQQKVLAAQALIMKQTSDAQGDFQRTSGGLANQQRILSATFEDTKTQLGEKLLPAATSFVTMINDKFFPALGGLKSLLVDGDFTGALRDAFGWEEDSPAVGALLAVRSGFMSIVDAVRASGPTLTGIWSGFGAQVSAMWAVAGPALAALWKVISQDIAPSLLHMWADVAFPIFRDLGAKVQEMWALAQPALTALWGIVRDDLAPALLWLWQGVVQPAMSAIGELITNVWFGVISPAMTQWMNFMRDKVGPAVVWLYTNVVKPMFQSIGGNIKSTWDNVIHPVLSAMSSVIGGMGTKFAAARDAIGAAWSGIGDAIRAPIVAVVEFLNSKFIDPINDLLEKVGASFKIPSFPVPTSGKYQSGANYATGGVLPGYTPGRDVHTFYSPTGGRLGLSGGEAIMRPEWTRAVGPRLIAQWNKAARMGGAGAIRRILGGGAGFARGGILGFDGGGILDVIKGAKEKAEGIIGAVTDVITDPVGALKKLGQGLLSAIPFGGSMVGELAKGGASQLLTGVIAKVKDSLASLVGGTFGRGGDWPARQYWRVSPNTSAAVAFIRQMFGLTDIGTLGARSNKSDHPWGKAADFMIPNWRGASGIGLGNTIANWFVANPGRFGTKYVIWRDRINTGSGWRPYTHPSGNTTNPTLRHMDHVHTSFLAKGGIFGRPALKVFDGGGWFEQGDVGTHLRREPDAVLTAQQWSAVLAHLPVDGGGGAAGVDRSIHFHGDVSDADRVREALDDFRRAEQREDFLLGAGV